MANWVWASIVTLLLVIACTVADIEPQYVILPILLTVQLAHWMNSKEGNDETSQ